jgi:REP element-mobilizing transposase RayT
MKFDPQKHHRRSIRLPEYDYTRPGGYFVTIAAYGRECLFGEVVGGEVVLNDMGRIAEECWRAIPEHFPNAELGVYVVMPNHLHGIIILHEHGRGTKFRAPTATSEQFQKPVEGSIPTIVRTYKAAVTRHVGRELDGGVVWQKNYYEHIIRNDEDANRIHRYIEANPAMWAEDKEIPGRK